MSLMDEAKSFFEQLKKDTLEAHKKALEGIVNEATEEVLRDIENADSLEKVKIDVISSWISVIGCLCPS